MTSVDCPRCRELDRALNLMLASYMAARSAAFYRVCSDVAAKIEVDMERAKTVLLEHQIACASAIRAEVANLADRTGAFPVPLALRTLRQSN
jgi:hypothetical protein